MSLFAEPISDKSSTQNYVLLRFALCVCVLLLGACESSDEETQKDEGDTSVEYVEMGDDYGLTTKIRGNQSLTRRWVRPEVEKITSLSEGSEYTLFTPRPADIRAERIYIYDYGDYTVKAFTLQGEYVTTYGRGRGQGPGEIMMMTDFGVWRDSLVYVVDPRQSRVSFFEKNGDFAWSELYETRVARLALTEDSTAFEATPPSVPTFMRIVSPTGRRTVISQLFSGDVPPIMVDGSFQTTQKKALYVPKYFPILLTYASHDTTGVAYPTPDYGQPRPKARTKNGGRQVFAPSTRFQWRSTLSGGVLSVEIPDSKIDSLQFDLYDAHEMEYMHSVRLPIDNSGAHYAHESGVVLTYEEATANLYQVQKSN